MIRTPPPPLSPARFEFDGAGIAFRIWLRPVVSDGGKAVTPVTLLWRHPDGTSGKRPCEGFVEATEYAAKVVAQADTGPVVDALKTTHRRAAPRLDAHVASLTC